VDHVPRHKKPLIIRAGLARTFGSLASFLALLFLLLGMYLMQDAFEHPLDAQAAAVLAAALSMTLAVVLLFYLLKPHHGKREGGSAV
jgi:riboflavin transporter FmnP